MKKLVRRRVQPSRQLNTNERAFALEYLANGENGSAAYQAVHPKAKPATAKVEASRLLTKPNVREFVTRELRARYKRLQIDGDHVLALVSQDATAKMSDLFDAADNLLPPSQWPASVQNSIEGYEKRADGSFRVKLTSKTAARRTLLEQSGKLKSPLEAGLSALERALRKDLGEDADADG